MKKQDMRVERTEKHLRAALFELLEEKPIHKITVKELTEKAEVSRATFYLYYDNIETMVSSIETEILQKYADDIHMIGKKSSGYFDFLQAALLYTFKSTYDILPFARLMYSDLIGQSNLNQCIFIIYDTAQKLFSSAKDAKRYDMLMTYEINGVIGIIKKWIFEEPMTASPGEMAQKTIDLILNGANYHNEIKALTRKKHGTV